ncbi:hypothetical protein [Blastopirellula marina]|uniref:Uncharacterized protein n=1 Tax=Blastopirellula marina TaxID=124 RepID=A0A2S8F4D2_9BACT|nr:hypothetical protein [Blastopirellula marina]PQO27022.1 hypothetical protein C5Y98_27580 [Blastopirellula marina]PTL41169.1 hypothetical protein C5Y97_27595 [Blastopirellula marina]
MTPINKRRLLLFVMTFPLACLGLVGAWFLYGWYEGGTVVNRSLEKKILALRTMIEQIEGDAGGVEDQIVAKMKRGVPVHPIGKSPLNESPLIDRALPILLRELVDDREAVACYAEHDLFRLTFSQEQTQVAIDTLIGMLSTTNRIHHLVNVLHRLKADPPQVIPHLVAAVDRDTFENLRMMSVRIQMFDPDYDLHPLFLECLRQQDAGGEELIRWGLMARFLRYSELENALQQAIAESSDAEEIERLNRWVKYIQTRPTQQHSPGPVTSY